VSTEELLLKWQARELTWRQLDGNVADVLNYGKSSGDYNGLFVVVPPPSITLSVNKG
jgi:hypothetical protein